MKRFALRLVAVATIISGTFIIPIAAEASMATSMLRPGCNSTAGYSTVDGQSCAITGCASRSGWTRWCPNYSRTTRSAPIERPQVVRVDIVSCSEAVVHGYVNTNGTQASVWLLLSQDARTLSYNLAEVPSGITLSHGGGWDETLQGLVPGTRYYVKAAVNDRLGHPTYSNVLTFVFSPSYCRNNYRDWQYRDDMNFPWYEHGHYGW